MENLPNDMRYFKIFYPIPNTPHMTSLGLKIRARGGKERAHINMGPNLATIGSVNSAVSCSNHFKNFYKKTPEAAMKPTIISLSLCVWSFSSSFCVVKAFASSNNRNTRVLAGGDALQDDAAVRQDKDPIAKNESRVETESQNLDNKSTQSPASTSLDNRRQVLTKARGLLAAAVVGEITTAMPSDAVDAFPAVGGVKVSKRAGGLAQKIRGGVCFKMVGVTYVSCGVSEG